MIWVIGIGTLVVLGTAIFCFWWVYREGKSVARDRDKVITLEAHQASVKRWAKDVDQLAATKEELQNEVTEIYKRGANVGDLTRVFNDARRTPIRKTNKT